MSDSSKAVPGRSPERSPELPTRSLQLVGRQPAGLVLGGGVVRWRVRLRCTTRVCCTTWDEYQDTLTPLFATGKPVLVTELGFPACSDADQAGVPRIYHGP